MVLLSVLLLLPYRLDEFPQQQQLSANHNKDSNTGSTCWGYIRGWEFVVGRGERDSGLLGRPLLLLLG